LIAAPSIWIGSCRSIRISWNTGITRTNAARLAIMIIIIIMTTAMTITTIMVTITTTHSVKSISLTGGDLDPEMFFPWINQVTQIQGPNILRMKGILAFKDDPQRYVIQGVHMIVEGDHQRDWKSDEPRESRLVFIGRDLNWDVLKANFKACAAE
jgi:hypothetical protein